VVGVKSPPAGRNINRHVYGPIKFNVTEGISLTKKVKVGLLTVTRV